MMIAAVLVNWAPFRPFLDELEALNRNRIAVTASPYSGQLLVQPDSRVPSEMPAPAPLVIRQRTDEPPPPPCFFYQEPGLKGRIICTR
jgi:hypothetical protein